jgi:putative flippase GtrA
VNVAGFAALRRFLGSELGGQLLRYGVSGVGLTLFYSLVYLAALDLAEFAPLIANCLAFLCTVTLGYFVHGRWSFRGHGDRDRPMISTVRFLVVNVMGFALNSFWVWLIAERLALSPRLPLIPIVFVTPWVSFWLNRRWTFR